HRPVALKVPRLEVLSRPDLRVRFLLEARAVASLEHPNVVPVHEAGEVGGGCYVISAYCPGPTLGDAPRCQPAPPTPRPSPAGGGRGGRPGRRRAPRAKPRHLPSRRQTE